MMGVDILELSRTNSGNKYVIVFTDYLTKWVEAFAIRDHKAETIAKIFINEILSWYSALKKLLSDQCRPKYRIPLSELEELFVFFLVNSSAEITNLKELASAHLPFAHYRFFWFVLVKYTFSSV